MYPCFIYPLLDDFASVKVGCRDGRMCANMWSGVTKNRHNPVRSSSYLLPPSPPLIEMADERRQTSKVSKGIRNQLKKFKKAIGLGSDDLYEAAKLRAKYTRFRILVIGRANAGKTTLLKRVCNTTEEPSIYDEDKNLVSYRLIVISHSHHSFINQLEPTSKVLAW